MTCRDVVEFLSDYLDGTLSAELQAVFERHLAACPECRVYLSSYRATIELERQALCDLDGAAADPPPPELIAAILASRRDARE